MNLQSQLANVEQILASKVDAGLQLSALRAEHSAELLEASGYLLELSKDLIIVSCQLIAEAKERKSKALQSGSHTN